VYCSGEASLVRANFHVAIFVCLQKILSGSLQSLLASKDPELLLKAKSEVSLSCTTSQSLSVELSTATLGASTASTTQPHNPNLPQISSNNTVDLFSSNNTSQIESSAIVHSSRIQSPRQCESVLLQQRKKSQSLEQLNSQSQAMWKSDVEEVILAKGHKGLGFSILDYQDPLNMSETVIVVRSLVPGGVAQLDGRLVPGDRIIYVNTVQLEHASLDAAVQALKGAPFGPVNVGIARPIMDAGAEGQAMMGQLRDRLAAESEIVANTVNTTTTVSTEEVSRSQGPFLISSFCHAARVDKFEAHLNYKVRRDSNAKCKLGTYVCPVLCM
jgi:hypothetical protein